MSYTLVVTILYMAAPSVPRERGICKILIWQWYCNDTTQAEHDQIHVTKEGERKCTTAVERDTMLTSPGRALWPRAPRWWRASCSHAPVATTVKLKMKRSTRRIVATLTARFGPLAHSPEYGQQHGAVRVQKGPPPHKIRREPRAQPCPLLHYARWLGRQ
jgi:hypothetical protein